MLNNLLRKSGKHSILVECCEILFSYLNLGSIPYDHEYALFNRVWSVVVSVQMSFGDTDSLFTDDKM